MLLLLFFIRNRSLLKIKHRKIFYKNKQRFCWDSRYHISPGVGVRWGLSKLWGLYLYYGKELSHAVCYSVINLGVMTDQERCHRPWPAWEIVCE